MVNAILRKIKNTQRILKFKSIPYNAILRDDGSAIILQEIKETEKPILDTASMSSLPKEVFNRWEYDYGNKTASFLAKHCICEPPISITNNNHFEIKTNKNSGNNFTIFNGTKKDLVTYLNKNSLARVQDPHTADSLHLAEKLSPKIIFDYSAGKGTKTKQLSELFPNSKILAHDINTERSYVLKETCSKIHNAYFISTEEIKSYIGKIDLLLLDVPCSNSGVIPRRPEAKYRLTNKNLENLIKLQKQIIADSIPLLKMNGHILYVTCSIERKENQDITKWIIKYHPFTVLEEKLNMPKGLPGEAPSNYADGGYSALLERSIHAPNWP